MKKFAYGAFALVAVAAASQASDSGWSGLDQEINSLTASIATQNATGPKVSGYLITALNYEDPPGGPSVDENIGWDFRSIRIQVSGDLGHDYSYRVSFDLDDDDDDNLADDGNFANLKDAYVDWKITDGIKGRWGRYKMPIVRSGLISEQKLLFLERTRIGDLLGGRELGAMINGQFEMVNFWVNVQNGEDGIVRDVFVNGRVTIDVMGDGVAMIEGAYGAGDAMGLSLGLAAGEDTSIDNGLIIAFEAALTSGPLSVAAEVADFDEDVGGAGVADTTPWDITASFMFAEMYEIAVRYEDYDDDIDDTTGYGAALCRYIAGHDIKWTLQWRHIERDSDNSDEAALGLTVGF